MATPPPEGAILEEKPQLPLPVGEVKLDSKSDSVAPAVKPVGEIIPEANQAAVDANKDISNVNGNGVSQSATNGDTSHNGEGTSMNTPPSKSPTVEQVSNGQPSADAQTQEISTEPARPAENGVSKPTEPSPAPQGQEHADKANLDSTAPTSERQTSATESAQPAPPENTEISPLPSASESQPKPTDEEMPDAPIAPASPSKVQRERDVDETDEPAAKRTKTNSEERSGNEFKVPSLPASQSAAAGQSEAGPKITKLQQKFLLKTLGTIKRAHDSRFFREPVNWVKMSIPSYPEIIKRPMDLRTMEDNVKGDKYTTVKAIKDDFNLMVTNAATFNGAEHIVAVEGKKLEAQFLRQLENIPSPDAVEPSPAEKKAKKAPTVPRKETVRRETRAPPVNPRPAVANATSPTFALSPEGIPLIRRDSAAAGDGRPKRSIHPPKNRDLPYSTKPKKKKYQWELKFCQEILDELHKTKHYQYAAPFYLPVDPVALNIPTYHSIIKKPMDLSTVQEKLKTGQYENAKEFEVDVRQIFKNCYKFNIPGDPTYTAGKKTEEVFDIKWAQKTRWLEAHEPSSGHQSGSSENESEDDADDSEEDRDREKLDMLQRQIAEMSKQVEAITQKKKKTPPTISKKGKTKLGHKDAKKSSTGGSTKKDKKSGSKSSKSDQGRWVSYKEKQIISNGISSLPDKKMQEALKIIQSNVPALKGTQEAEIELDIDELPNNVLVMLLKFVKKHAPLQFEEEDEDAEPVTSAAPAKPKKNKPMSKFEQEAQIHALERSLSGFRGGAQAHEPVASVENDESSEDDEDSEESEEE